MSDGQGTNIYHEPIKWWWWGHCAKTFTHIKSHSNLLKQAWSHITDEKTEAFSGISSNGIKCSLSIWKVLLLVPKFSYMYFFVGKVLGTNVSCLPLLHVRL